MSKTVTNTTDNNEPVDLDADLTEFEKYAREHLPKLSPKSPYYQLEEQHYDFSTYVRYDELRETLFPTVPTPVWHSPDAATTFRSKSPVAFAHVSEDYQVRLRREQGLRSEEGLACATLHARLVQNPTQTEAYIQFGTRCLVQTKDGNNTLGYPVGADNTNMTLDEAVELAHLLLLLVDVARDTTAVQE